MKKYDYKSHEDIRSMVLEQMRITLTKGIENFKNTDTPATSEAFCVASGIVIMANAIIEELDAEADEE